MDRNCAARVIKNKSGLSLSARRAWIEIIPARFIAARASVALRKESVDRNKRDFEAIVDMVTSLSARRAWIEIMPVAYRNAIIDRRSPQGERG